MKFLVPAVAVLLGFILPGCTKCKLHDSYQGIVLGYSDSTACITTYAPQVINSQEQLDSVNRIGLYNGYCDTQHFDFSRFTLLSYGFAGSCHSRCISDVEVDTASSAYIYTLK